MFGSSARYESVQGRPVLQDLEAWVCRRTRGAFRDLPTSRLAPHRHQRSRSLPAPAVHASLYGCRAYIGLAAAPRLIASAWRHPGCATAL